MTEEKEKTLAAIRLALGSRQSVAQSLDSSTFRLGHQADLPSGASLGIDPLALSNAPPALCRDALTGVAKTWPTSHTADLAYVWHR